MSPFPLPIMFTAWVWQDGAGIAGEVIRRAKLGGFKTVAVQLSREGADGGSSLDKVDVDYLHEAGLFVVGWDPVGSDTARQFNALPFDGWLPQVEGPGQRDALIAQLKAGAPGPVPKALVTTYGGLDTTADVAALTAAWGGPIDAFVECYKADGFPHNDISRMLSQGEVYGFDGSRLRALVGTYQQEMPVDYPGLTPANYGGIYLEENTTDAQLTAFAAIEPTEEAPTPVIPNPATLNEKIAKLADSWLSCFPGDAKALTRLRSIFRIASTTDAQWVAVRQSVVDSLDGKTVELRAQLASMTEALANAKDELTRTKATLASESAARIEATSALNDALARIAAAQKALL